MLSLYQVMGRAWSGKEGGGSGEKEPLRVFRVSFHSLCTFSSWSLWTDHWMISIWEWVGGGGVLCSTVLQAHPLCRTTPLIPAPPSNFQMCVRYVIFVSLLSSLVCKANLACHFELVSIQWRPLKLFVVVFVVAACVWLWIYKQASSYVYRYQHQLRSEF